MPFVSIGGVTLHHRYVEAAASARPIIFINSLGTDFRIWDEIVARLAGEMPLLLYDKRGHGLSDLGEGVRSIDDHVDDLSALIDHFSFDKVVLCGLSVGGMVAQRFYARRPGCVEALILSDTAHKIGTDESWNSRIATIERDGIEAIADGVMKVWFTPEFHAGRSAELAGCRNMLTRQALAGYVGTCIAVRDTDFTDSARRIAVPTLCIVGDQDGSTPPDLVRSLAGLIPGARFEVIRDAGHITCIEQPDALATLVRGFVASLGKERRAHE
ncbi:MULTISPECIES: 3-oxoadipate enol-lactonase [unclassified Mesorhizobium]|uniref:3-oxoadipate enol-lactonase n=1 Tax=unclassified Mesorhizobium TaxID=325217 RepID=UPI000BB08FA2|nr:MULTISPECIES: 3-oxoadipate enol-lactonase [unclassified Mesorhizobium]TGT58647.1 3-oxoadipate enol-lactonase [Mesorhizobium sp. M00.F.Ca.ET.170.01.1.1]AZO12116.1 3-oxoadipate enol-lactonase [Mesorhizobium sp. M3A.F.Ca.ET.080.04.2.1]PBB84403.1 3-oxoadipate enol-lactonase [Mesorhizobium sp. WSM3876]RWB74830.1 MAG: 3-oxoadipate enol-lactonase [Mesorhizobium sp.]RWB89710.1 MAG: 3-oxoadipate enol-lactonase [Mesorhizobium sp.]